jgi:alanyl-tRNA synthetase
MRVKDIRELFLDFFKKRGHRILPSSSLIPQADPTLLFTNAGMVQFKKYFLGEEEPEYINVATVQRCLRAGGKHNDLENVGRTARHMTFFEMLGNFSFGGYFKKEAISMAWEFVTEYLKIPKEKIYATVYEEDEEAEKIWRNETDVKDVFKLGKKDNFWTMGDEGPAGPCSEIIVDRGEDYSKDHNCSGVVCGCDRYLEIWNLVFMQYNLLKDGSLQPLKRKNIDTGMGLERVASVVQNVPSVFDTDVFQPLRKVLESEIPSISKDIVAVRVILDSSRASAFSIADGIMPSNESRGYVIRRIIRRALRFALNYTDEPFLYKIAVEVATSMSDFWTHLKDKTETIEKAVRAEEERFFETISRVLPLFIKEVSDLKSAGEKEIPAEMVFTFWDTHGLPIDLMKEIAQENSLFIDEQKLEKIIEQKKTHSRKKKEEEENIKRKLFYFVSRDFTSEFVGYNTLQSESHVVYIFDDKFERVSYAKQGDEYFIVTDETPFYPEGGGQVGDKGEILGRNGFARVSDTKKLGNIILHRIKVEKGEISVGDKVLLRVDEPKREQNARHHTTTHLLHSALRKILGTHVRQMGSLVEPKRLRFDFSHHSALSPHQLEDIEHMINEWIMMNMPVEHENMKLEEALKKGALAFFGDKYGKIVRVVKIGEVSLELCGGTHLRKTGEAGILKIIKETSVASGIRRVEAVAGWELLNYIREKEKFVEEIANVLKVSPQDIMPRLISIIDEKKKLESEVESLRKKLIFKISEPVIKELNGLKLIFDFLEGVGRKELGDMVDNLREKFTDSVVVLLSYKDDKISIVCGVSDAGKLDASEIVKELARFLGGSGGGRKDFAEGAGKIKKSKEEILAYIQKIISEMSR